jgi:hypothetical protein
MKDCIPDLQVVGVVSSPEELAVASHDGGSVELTYVQFNSQDMTIGPSSGGDDTAEGAGPCSGGAVGACCAGGQVTGWSERWLAWAGWTAVELTGSWIGAQGHDRFGGCSADGGPNQVFDIFMAIAEVLGEGGSSDLLVQIMMCSISASRLLLAWRRASLWR